MKVDGYFYFLAVLRGEILLNGFLSAIFGYNTKNDLVDTMHLRKDD